MRQACEGVLGSYGKLARGFPEGDMWRWRPKFHMFWELSTGISEVSGCPSRYWCYFDETYMQLVSHICHRKGGRSGAVSACTMAIAKYRAYMTLNELGSDSE